MFSKAEEDQMMLERIADTLIDNDDYFLMDDPSAFLEWAVAHTGDWTDLDLEGDPEVDFEGMLYHWLENKEAA
ncbi:hypothetical protein DSS3P8_135 [Roseobacter phage DSS3P8]|nr:hypothetical protein DSS3P8_135 [Roseobacter phage DSS3P8]